MNNKQVITLEDWMLLPEHGGKVCAVGLRDGRDWQTTSIVAQRIQNGVKELRTSTGSIYHLGNQKPGLWPINLQAKRPEIYQKFADAGFF